MINKLIMIKYGELTTKKGNRRLFISTLYKNILDKLDGYNFKITLKYDCMYIESNDNIDSIINILKNIFGIHSIIIVHQVNTNTSDIEKKVIELLSNITFKTFKVITKRSDKTFPILSTDFSKKIGGFILDNIPNKKVDIHNPETNIIIEIKKDYTYIYFDDYEGLGGYPVGIQGKGLLMLSGGIDSPVAGYLAIKRGVSLDCLYFESPPHTSDNAKNKVIKLIEKLNVYGHNIKLHVVPFTEIQEEIYKNVDPNYMITILRRMMYRISDIYAKKIKAKILINGESIGQVASQTLASMSVINEVTNMPVIRPVACLDKLEIIELSKKIDTYETSILPYEDCCTIFVPKHPVINPSLDKCVKEEDKIDYQPLIENTINNIEVIKFTKKTNNLL